MRNATMMLSATMTQIVALESGPNGANARSIAVEPKREPGLFWFTQSGMGNLAVVPQSRLGLARIRPIVVRPDVSTANLQSGVDGESAMSLVELVRCCVREIFLWRPQMGVKVVPEISPRRHLACRRNAQKNVSRRIVVSAIGPHGAFAIMSPVNGIELGMSPLEPHAVGSLAKRCQPLKLVIAHGQATIKYIVSGTIGSHLASAAHLAAAGTGAAIVT